MSDDSYFFVGSKSSTPQSWSAGFVAYDLFQRPWILQEDLQVDFDADVWVEIETRNRRSVELVYEVQMARDSLEPCPMSGVCCSDAFGSSYVRFLKKKPEVHFVSEVSLRHSGNTTLFVNGRDMDGKFEYISTVLLGGSDLENSTKLVCNKEEDCFFVPSIHFGPDQNQVGMTNNSYGSITNICETPLGHYVNIGAFGTDDQFSIFRSKTMPHFLDSLCAVRSSARFTYDCPSRTSFLFQLQGHEVSFRPAFGVPSLISLSSNASVASISIANIGYARDLFLLTLSCSSQSQTMFLEVGETASVAFSVLPNISFTSCFLSISSHETVLSVISLNPANERSESSCTVDQTPPFCHPKDCFSAYLGQRNFYNANTGLCEPTTVCNSGELYDPSDNTCKSQSEISPETYAPIDDDGEEGCCREPSNPIVLNETLQCVQGTIVSSPNGPTCVCNDGWITEFSQPFYDFKYCNLPISDTAEDALIGSQLQGQPVSNFVIFLIVISLFGASVIGCCVCVCVCKAQKRKKKLQKQKLQQEQMYAHLFSSWADISRVSPSSAFGSLPENSLNFSVPTTNAAQEEILRLANSESLCFFRVSDDETVPGTLMTDGAGTFFFKVSDRHELYQSSPITKMTMSQCLQYITLK